MIGRSGVFCNCNQWVIEGRTPVPANHAASCPIHTLTAETYEMAPLGVLPRWLVTEYRLQDLRAATLRYTLAGEPVPSEWITEINDLTAYLENL